MTVAAQTATGGPDTKPAFVYVIGHDGSNLVKIGKADDVAKRLAGIQRMSPVKLRVLAHFDGGFRYEKALHQKFDHLRTHGEWFDFGDLDPVAEVSAAVAVLVEADEAEARAVAARAALPATVVQIGKKLWVMHGDGQFKCVDSVKGKRRCRNFAVDPDEFNRRRIWAVPGIGVVEGYTVSVYSKAEEERIMLQLCQAHYEGFAEERHYGYISQPVGTVMPPMWEAFDLIRHADLIRQDEYGRGHTLGDTMQELFHLVPGLHEHLAKEVRRLMLELLPPATISAFRKVGLVGEPDA